MRFISLDASDLRIEALVPEKNNVGVIRTILFRAGEISYVMDVSDKVSALVLKNNVTIAVALPYQELNRMIYEPDFRQASLLDLKPFTGPAIKDVLVPKLADEFNAPSKSGLVISAILRRGSSNNAVGFDFSESDIASYSDESGTRSKTGHSVRIIFNALAKTPFGKDATHHIDMPYADFMKELVNAKKNGLAKLDLCSLFVANPNRYGFDPA
ncbi:MAG: hypothetical protein K8R48_03035 [Alphaproteobacteria bacterium]|nr:hypothetical protein [Alphaproteobacteria bacterium]